jgi:hypothetical protein
VVGRLADGVGIARHLPCDRDPCKRQM